MKILLRLAVFCMASSLCLSVGCGSASSSSGTLVSGSGGGGTTAALAVTGVTPVALPVGSAAMLTVSGTGFTSSTTVQVNGTALTTTYVSSTQVTAAVAAGQFTNASVLTIAVSDKGVTSSVSNVTLEVDNPLPAVTGLNPSSALVGSGATNVSVGGTGFVNGTVIRVNGVSRTTAYTSTTALMVTLDPMDASATGSLSVTAVNLSPGGGSSEAVPFAVVNPVPGAISVSPASVDGGGTADIPITISGSNFVASSVVQIGGTARTTTYVSGTQLRASLTAADAASARSLPVVVITPGPGGGTSASSSITINPNPVPALSSVSPASLVAGTAVILHVFGGGFVASSSILWNGSPVTTQFVSATELTTSVDASTIVTAGTAILSVRNPAPGGGLSATLSLPINSAVPTLTSIAPMTVFRSSASTVITLQGTGFQPTSTVLWNGAAYATKFVSSTQLSITVQAGDLPTGVSTTVQVSTPAPGGGISGTLPVNILNVKPIITAVTERVSGTVCQQLVLSVTGQFLPVSGSVVRLNGTPLTNVISGGSTSLLATVPASVGAVANPQLTVEYSAVSGEVSDAFALSPSMAVCLTPTMPIIYPGTTFAINSTAVVLGATTPPAISAITLPAGLTAVTPAPYALPSQIAISTAASLTAGSASMTVQETGLSTYTATIPLTVVSTPPSLFFSSPSSREVAVPLGGSATLSVQTIQNYSSNGTPDYLITPAVTGLPPGVAASFQPAKIFPGDSATITLSAAANAPVRQNISITVTGTVDGSTMSASLAYSLDVTPAPGTLANNRTNFAPTEATPVSVAYDRVHNLIFASNPVWNRIDVISNVTHTLVQSIPLTSPAAIDLSQDNGTLWIGTQSQQVFALNTSTLILRKYVLPNVSSSSAPSGYPWVDSELYALSSGNLLLVLNSVLNGTSLGAFVWSPSTGNVTAVTMGNALIRSRDGSKVFGLVSGFSGCQMNVYSVAQAGVTTYSIDTGFTGSSYCGSFQAANSDGSIIVASLTAASLHGIQWINSMGQSLGEFTATLTPGTLSTPEGVNFFPRTFVFSDDGRTLYQTGSLTGRGSLVATYDVSSRTLLGLAPAIASPTPPLSSGYGGNTALVAADSSGVLIGIQNFGVAFEDSTYFQDYGTGSTSISGGSPTSFAPQSGPLSGGTSFSINPYVVLQPDVWYGDIRGTTALANNALTITSPAGSAPGPVNLKLIYPNGELGYAAQGFSYGPYPQNIVYGGSSPAGGATSEVTGFGLPVDSNTGSVSVGGNSATITSTVGQYPPWTGESIPSTFLKFTVPAGSPGLADLQVTTPSGSGTLPRALFYASSLQSFSFTGTASAVIYDKYRRRSYVLTKDSVLVFSLDSGGFQAPLTVPAVHNIFDLRDGALSTDGNYLLVGNAGDGSVAVLDLVTPSSSYAIAIPELVAGSTACIFGPGSIAALSAGRAFVLPVNSNSQCGVFSMAATIDLQAHSEKAFALGGYCNGTLFYPEAQGSGDGTQVVFKTSNSSTCFYSPITGVGSSGSVTAGNTASISADGNLIAGDLALYTNAGNLLGRLAEPPALYGNSLSPSYPVNSRAVQLRGAHLNAAGGLYYVPHVGYFEIIDTLTNTLRMRFALKETLQDIYEPLAIDEGGRHIFLITDAGLTVVDMGLAPLSAGHFGTVQPASGATVQLRGSGFDASTTVKVGSTDASATVVDEDTLNILLPGLTSGSYDLTLTRSDGSTLTARGMITIP